mmetsp:Transcript_8470/g.14031  ORF Transcript_8470/g.14031 Transcript_8470/m.14031 type:complete len:87 (-) Transcript_8470:88-348(-)
MMTSMFGKAIHCQRTMRWPRAWADTACDHEELAHTHKFAALETILCTQFLSFLVPAWSILTMSAICCVAWEETLNPFVSPFRQLQV